MSSKKKVYYAIYSPTFQGIVFNHDEYKEKVNGKKKTFGKKCKDEKSALNWLEIKKNGVTKIVEKKQEYYAITRPDKQIIVTTLKEFNSNTKGYRNAHGKKFNNRADAEKWLKQRVLAVKNTEAEIVTMHPVVKTLEHTKQSVIYIDGSFKDGFGKYGFVVFSINGSEKIFQSFGYVYDDKFNALMNAGAELMACLRALEWAYSNEMQEVHIIYDFEGVVSHFKSIKENTNETICLYQKMVASFHRHMNIHFLHVRHCNRANHELAHKLTQLTL